MKKHTEHNKGFTLIETLVGITVLILAIVGPMTIAARGLQSAFFAKEQFVAFYLAQEAIEEIRKFRDENALSSNSWLSGLHASCTNGDGCGFDVRDNSFRDCSAAPDACRLRYDSAALASNRGFYTYSAGTLTQFTREINVTETLSDQEADVSVTVSWQSSLFPKTVTVQARMFNQYDDIP